MSERSLFRVLLKIMALCLVLYGGHGFVVTLAGAASLNTAVRQLGGASLHAPSIGHAGVVAMLIGPTIDLLVGLYLFLGGEWIVRAALPGFRGSAGNRDEPLWQRLAREAAAPVRYVPCSGCGAKLRPDDTTCPMCRRPRRGPNGGEAEP